MHRTMSARQAPQRAGGTAARMYNGAFCTAIKKRISMEAEQLNSISNKLDDLAQRAAELRRYL